MWYLFKRCRDESAFDNDNSFLGLNITRKCYLFVQDKWAKKMSSVASKLSNRMLIYLLTSFVIVTGGICICIISESFYTKSSNCLQVISISKPAEVFEKFSLSSPRSQSFSKEELRRILDFRIYLDSLVRSPAGKSKYDSIYRCRPGLIDSLVFIENYYKSNFKN